MTHIAIRRMWERVELARADSDTALFLHLMYAGEMLVKLAAAVLTSTVLDDRDRNRYRVAHRLVRADSLGEWTQAIDDVLTGPASQHLSNDAREIQRELTTKVGAPGWQRVAVLELRSALEKAGSVPDELRGSVALRNWFHLFAELRNDTRGHGAPSPGTCRDVCVHLESAIRALIENMALLKLPSAYVRQNFSGKYKVVPVGGDTACFEYLKKTTPASHGETLVDGLYVFLQHPFLVDLMYTDVDLSDFFFPNGAFRDASYEVISYATNDRVRRSGKEFVKSAGLLPPSETHGLSSLDVEGSTFHNLPASPSGYIRRSSLEDDLRDELSNDRHPVVTDDEDRARAHTKRGLQIDPQDPHLLNLKDKLGIRA